MAAARHTRGCLIGNRGLPEADVLHVATEETDLLPVVFREHLLYRAGDGEEVRGIGLEMDLRHAVDEPVEAAGGDVFQKPGRFVFGADHGDHLVAGVELVDDVGEVLRRMLEIRIHEDEAVARSVVESGGHRRFVPEIPGEVQHAHMGHIAGSQIIQDLRSPVAGAVVHEDELVIPALRRKRLPIFSGRLIEGLQSGLFIISGNHQAQ